jgi:hypothetical protein
MKISTFLLSAIILNGVLMGANTAHAQMNQPSSRIPAYAKPNQQQPKPEKPQESGAKPATSSNQQEAKKLEQPKEARAKPATSFNQQEIKRATLSKP